MKVFGKHRLSGRCLPPEKLLLGQNSFDGLLVRQTWGTNYMDFLYDESGSAYSFICNGTQYYYVKNLQGDVTQIINTSGAVVATYTYDAWGKVTGSGNSGTV